MKMDTSLKEKNISKPFTNLFIDYFLLLEALESLLIILLFGIILPKEKLEEFLKTSITIV